MVGQSLEFTSFETECFEQHFSNVLRSLNINPNGVEGEIQVPGMVLKEFFKSSLLPTLVLKEVWNIVDYSNTGFLTKTQFFQCLRLIAHAQDKKLLSPNLIYEPSTLPKFHKRAKQMLLPSKIITQSPSLDSLSEQSEISPIESTQFPNTPIIDWYMTDEERDKYLSLFIQLQPINGVVPAPKVKEFLLQSNLPVASLNQIWRLSDIDQDGELNEREFGIAMHLVYAKLAGQQLPPFLPTSLLQDPRKSTSPKNDSQNEDILEDDQSFSTRRHSRSVSVEVPKKINKIQVQSLSSPHLLSRGSYEPPSGSLHYQSSLSSQSQSSQSSQQSTPSQTPTPTSQSLLTQAILQCNSNLNISNQPSQNGQPLYQGNQSQNESQSQQVSDESFSKGSRKNSRKGSDPLESGSPMLSYNQSHQQQPVYNPVQNPTSNSYSSPSNHNSNMCQNSQMITISMTEFQSLLMEFQEIKKEQQKLSTALQREKQHRSSLQQEIDLLKKKVETQKQKI